jgi:pyruvate,water dikinase
LKIAGVVTDTGGMLTHAAIAAREYGIPAVVGTWKATNSIRNGDIVRVDGTAGVVEVIQRSALKTPVSSPENQETRGQTSCLPA